MEKQGKTKSFVVVVSSNFLNVYSQSPIEQSRTPLNYSSFHVFFAISAVKDLEGLIVHLQYKIFQAGVLIA